MSRWSKLFGSPTSAAYTIIDKELFYDLSDQCKSCPKYSYERCVENAFNEPCQMESLDALLEWLTGDDDE